MDQSKYESTDQTYVKVSLDQVITKAVSTKITATTDKNGNLYFDGLNAGTYTLKETIAPEGFNLDDTEYTLKIDWEDPEATDDQDLKDNAGFSIDESATSKDANGDCMFTIGDNEISTTIINRSGTELPSTGGIGTTLFYVIGAVLAVTAGVILVSRRRMNVQ